MDADLSIVFLFIPFFLSQLSHSTYLECRMISGTSMWFTDTQIKKWSTFCHLSSILVFLPNWPRERKKMMERTDGTDILPNFIVVWNIFWYINYCTAINNGCLTLPFYSTFTLWHLCPIELNMAKPWWRLFNIKHLRQLHKFGYNTSSHTMSLTWWEHQAHVVKRSCVKSHY